MRRVARHLLIAGAFLFVVGRAIDLLWHFSHDEFETAADQLRAHSTAWLGAAVLLVASVIRLQAPGPKLVRLSSWLMSFGSAAYLLIAVWHFYEHSKHRDPDLAHVLLALTQLALIGGLALFPIAHGLAEIAVGKRTDR